MFKTRLISGVILVALALLFIIVGGNLLLVVSAILSVIGLFELYRVFRIERTPIAICGYLFTIFYYIKLGNNNIPFLMLIMAFLLAILIIFVVRYPRYRSQHIMAAFFGVFYVGIMLSCVYQTRMLPDGVKAVVEKDSYEVPAIFKLLQKNGSIDEKMMYNTFNMGIGMVLAIDPADKDKVLEALSSTGDKAYVIGRVEAGEKKVELC